jgi:hypothetical protein
MESAIRKLKMNTLKGILELSRITSATLEGEFNRPDLPDQERRELFRRLDAVVRVQVSRQASRNPFGQSSSSPKGR